MSERGTVTIGRATQDRVAEHEALRPRVGLPLSAEVTVGAGPDAPGGIRTEVIEACRETADEGI
jgi:hypothetical protein